MFVFGDYNGYVKFDGNGLIKSGSYGERGSLNALINNNSWCFPVRTTIGSNQNNSISFNYITGNLNSRQNYRRNKLESFSYDNLYRLTDVDGPQDLSLTYEANGNISTKSDIGNSAFGYGDDTGPYALTGLESSTSVIPTYDQDVTYNSFQKVSTITENDTTATFIYNSDNERAKMVVTDSGNTILTRWYPGGSYMKETVSGTTTEYTYIGGDAYTAPVVAVTSGGTTNYYYLLRDHLGNITHQVNTSNTVVVEYSYDAWGRRRNPADWNYSLSGQPDLFAGRGFTGHEHLPWFNLINMNGRLYDPLVGRFLSPDNNIPAPGLTQGYNRYAYCLNNPLVITDPDGQNPLLIAAIILGGTMGAQQAVMNSTQTSFGGMMWDMAKGWFVGAVAGAAGAGVGGAVAKSLGTATTFGDAIFNGAISGAASGFSGGFVLGAGNAWVNGASFGEGLQSGLTSGGSGALSGGLIGGLIGGLNYQVDMIPFRKGCENLGINGGDPVPTTDDFLLKSQKVWYPDAPMDRIDNFTVEHVPSDVFTGKGTNAYAATPAVHPDGIITGRSNVYFNRNLAFGSAKTLYFTMGHEFVHVSQWAVLAGKSYQIYNQNLSDLMEFNAYSYQHSLGGTKLGTGYDVRSLSKHFPTLFNKLSYINFGWTWNTKFSYPF